MSIIVQAGHKTSKSKQLMEKLYERGLSRPADSYTHKMTPEQVSETLYKVLAREDMSSANEKMADNVMTDFLLANLAAENWGWESDKNLAGLEYWGQTEPDVRFILVFDHPKYIFTKGELGDIDLIVEEWLDYHQRLLSLVKANNSIILTNGFEALRNFSEFSSKIESSTSLKLKSNWQANDYSVKTEDIFQSEYTFDFLSDELIERYPKVIKVYNELVDLSINGKKSFTYSSKAYRLKKLKLAFKEYANRSEDTLVNIDSLQEVIKELNNKLLEEKVNTSKAEKRADNAEKISNQLQEVNIKNSILEKNNHELKSEKKLALEQIRLLKKEHSGFDSKYRSAVRDFNPSHRYTGAANRVKNSLSYRVGSVIVSSKKNPKSLALIPYKIFQEVKSFKSNHLKFESELPPLEQYSDYREAEKTQRHLSYRVGNLLVNGTKSPKDIIKLPLRFNRELKDFYRK